MEKMNVFKVYPIHPKYHKEFGKKGRPLSDKVHFRVFGVDTMCSDDQKYYKESTPHIIKVQVTPMREQRIDILSERVLRKADAICFTSNGVVKANGELVMGAGVAKAFREEFDIGDIAGQCVRENGNVCQIITDVHRVAGEGFDSTTVVAFPTKHHWRDPSDINLIKQSAEQLMELVDQMGWKLVALPFPGIGCGGLDKNAIKQILISILDDRVVLVSL